jgi:hypothetical protein
MVISGLTKVFARPPKVSARLPMFISRPPTAISSVPTAFASLPKVFARLPMVISGPPLGFAERQKALNGHEKAVFRQGEFSLGLGRAKRGTRGRVRPAFKSEIQNTRITNAREWRGFKRGFILI